MVIWLDMFVCNVCLFWATATKEKIHKDGLPTQCFDKGCCESEGSEGIMEVFVSLTRMMTCLHIHYDIFNCAPIQ